MGLRIRNYSKDDGPMIGEVTKRALEAVANVYEEQYGEAPHAEMGLEQNGEVWILTIVFSQEQMSRMTH